METLEFLVNLESLVGFLGKVLGDNCEIVLQDVQEGRVRAIANGSVSGRGVGAPLTDYALKIIQSGVWKERDYDSNYVGKTSDNHELRSSTFFIKDQNNNELLAMLCINIDKQPYQSAIDLISQVGMLFNSDNKSSEKVEDITKITYNDNNSIHYGDNLIENFSHNVQQIVTSLLPEVLGLPANIPLSRLTQEEKIKIIERLSAQGVFRIKGSIPEVAKVFECSDATIYRYLSKIE